LSSLRLRRSTNPGATYPSGGFRRKVARELTMSRKAIPFSRLGRGVPLERRRGGGGVAESDAGADEEAEADDPAGVGIGRRDEDEARADEDAADRRRQARSVAVLEPAGGNHREGEDEAADGVGVVQRREVPVEGAGAAGLDGTPDGALEDAPGVEDTQGQVDACPRRRYDLPPVDDLPLRHSSTPPPCRLKVFSQDAEWNWNHDR
jgi:hypothetical protein